MEAPNLILDLPTSILVFNLFPYLVNTVDIIFYDYDYENSKIKINGKKYLTYLLLSECCKKLRNIMTDNNQCKYLYKIIKKKDTQLYLNINFTFCYDRERLRPKYIYNINKDINMNNLNNYFLKIILESFSHVFYR